MKTIFTLLLSFYFLNACQNQDSASEIYGAGVYASNEGSFEGCIQGHSVDRHSVKVFYQIPVEATEFKIFRDGNLVSTLYPSHPAASGEFQDQNLREGGAYKYTCQAKIRGVYKRGTKELILKPVNTFAPKFEGVKKVELVGKSNGRLEWDPAREDGPVANYYQAYFSPGKGVTFNENPIKVEGRLSTLIERLGDELSYKFAVRACTINDICDGNIFSLQLETPDTGAPKTIGITDIYGKVGKKLVVIAPWSHEQGGVANRKLIVVRSQANETTSESEDRLRKCSNETESANCDYHNFSFVDGIITSSTLEIPIEENNTYFIRLVDEDKFQNKKIHPEIRKFESSDLTAPSFNGIITLSQPNPMTETLRATFQAPTDAVAVHLFTVSGKLGESLQNPCEQEGLGLKIPSAEWSGNSSQRYIEFAVNQRSQVRVCLKISDATGNLSDTKNFKTINTKDRLAPQFLGISGINIFNGKMNFTWNQATSNQSDIKEYQLKIKIARGIQNLNYDYSFPSQMSNGASLDIGSMGLALEDYDIIYAAVNVCDDALEKQVNSLVDANNCSEYFINEVSSINGKNKLALGIIKPPVRFDGVTQVTSTAHGTINIQWGRYNGDNTYPTSWSGFKIYSLKKDGTEEVLETVACPIIGEDAEKRAIYNCEDTREKTIGGLTPYAQLKILVRAFNSQGESQDIGADKVILVRVKDEVSPILSGNITSVETNTNLRLSWNSAVDTQSLFTTYDETTASNITYIVRRNGSTINTLQSREALIDLSKLSTGVHSFQVCARDEAGNTSTACLTTTYDLGDKVPPTVKIAEVKKLNNQIELKLDLRDETSPSNILCNNVNVGNSGSGISRTFESTTSLCIVSGISGIVANDEEQNVTITVKDQANNSKSINLTVKIDRLYKITSAKWGNWEASGAKRFALVIRGENILEGSSVQVAGANLLCEQADQFKMICFSSNLPSGDYLITSQGVTHNFSSRVNRSFNNCSYSRSPLQALNGFFYETIRVCNSQDWDNIRSIITSSNSGLNSLRNSNRVLTIELGNHLNFSSLNPINPSPGSFQSTLILDGAGYMMGGGNLITTNVSGIVYGGLFGNLTWNLDFKVRDLGIYKFETLIPSLSDFSGGHVYVGAIAGSLCSNIASFENVWIDQYNYADTIVKTAYANRIWKFGTLFGSACPGTSTLSKQNTISNVQVSNLFIQIPDFNSSSTITLAACALGCGGSALTPDSWQINNIQLSGMIKNIKGIITGGFENINLAQNSFFTNYKSSLELEGGGISGVALSIGNSASTAIDGLVLENKITTTVQSDATGLSGFSLNADLSIQNSFIRNQFISSSGKIFGLINTTGFSWAGSTPFCGTNPSLTFSNVELKSTYVKTGINIEAYSVGRLTRPVEIRFEEVALEDRHDSNRIDLNFIKPVRASSHCGTFDPKIEMSNVFINLTNQRVSNGEVINSNSAVGEAWMNDLFTRPFLKSSMERLGLMQVD